MDNFLRQLDDVLDKLKSSPIGDSLKKEIQAILNLGKTHYENLSELETKYAEVVDSYLTSNPPFEWNRVADPKKEQNFEKDLSQYHILIGYSLFANDNYNILKQWGIDYLLSPECPGLSQPVSDYIDGFIWFRDNKASDIQKPYYTYLIDNLK